MFPSRPRIAVIGAGAVGAYYGGRLAQHGHEVHFLLRSDYAAVKEKGWIIHSCDGDFFLPPAGLNVYDDPARMPPADLVLITLKTTSNDQYEPLIRPILKDNTAILTLQNGLGNEEQLAELFGAGRIMGGMCFVCINRVEPGVVSHLGEGLITIGEFDGPPDERLNWVQGLFTSARISCKILQSLRTGRWEKLVWNIPFNGLSAVMNQTTDLLIGIPEGESLVRAIMQEVIWAGRAVGAELSDDLIEPKIVQTRAMGAYKTSMHLDMQAGRRLEVEAIFGVPLRLAQKAGVAVPLLEMLYRMLKLRDAQGSGK